MIYLNGSLAPTASYPRREYAYLNVGNDGRTGTIFFNAWHAHRRHNTAVYSSSYSVGEVEAVGFAGRVFVVDKLTGEDEHPRKPGDRKPPYEVRCREYVGEDGEVTTVVSCNCMASGCNAPTCRHADLLRELIGQGAFDGEVLHDATSAVEWPNVTISERRHGNRRTEAPHGSERHQERQPTSYEARGSAINHIPMAEEGHDNHDWNGRTHSLEASQEQVSEHAQYFF